MKAIIRSLAVTIGFLSTLGSANANLINANSSNYTTFLTTLVAGDTLKLAPGTYTGNLTLNNRNGTAAQPIVILGSGNATSFTGQSCCNTVSITKCSYLVISSLQLDGNNEAIDAVKAEGTAGNFAHHITIQYLHIINYGSDQQNVGISTKCSAWDWVIRKNKIIGAGTGLYLGNSNGNQPFVNGTIEYNYIANTVGYNMEIKHQLNGVRDSFPGTSVNGKTIIRHNVFTKDNTSSTGGNARPNVLVGGFPTTGWGATDHYEIYGNFFYNNPVEALFQGTGNIIMYNNILVNHFDPPGFSAIALQTHNGVSPQNIKLFHNTMWAMNTAGGIKQTGASTSFSQYCYSNAVFTPNAITGFTNALDNVTDLYANASTHVLSATPAITTLDLYPKTGQLMGTLTPSTLFSTFIDWNKDFNGGTYNWTYRGAYSGCCTNPGWHLQLDTMTQQSVPASVYTLSLNADVKVYPNPATTELLITTNHGAFTKAVISDQLGRKVLSQKIVSTTTKINIVNLPAGVYNVSLEGANGNTVTRFVKVQ